MNPSVDNIVEPMNINRIQRFKKFKIASWYLKVDNNTAPEVKNQAHDLISYYLNTPFVNLLKRPFGSYEGHSGISSFKKRLRRSTKPIKMLKDPTALFSVPWLVQEFDVCPVLLIRHPAAYVLSIKEKNWWFDFDNLLSQSNFFSDGLAPLRTEVREFKKNESEKSIVENAALLWKVFYAQVEIYRKTFPDWFYITHEELSTDPMTNFERMFNYLGIEFNDRVRTYIKESTQAEDQAEFKRDSAKNTSKWKERLSSAEKQTIFRLTKEVSEKFYDSWVEE